MEYNNLEERARFYATQRHKGQLRKDGKTPYIEHPKAVVRILKEIGVKDEKTLASAWLHDVVEDTATSLEDIVREFGDKIAENVRYLTHDKTESRDVYAQRIVSEAPIGAQLVKLADMLHNTLKNNGIPDPIVREKGRNKRLYEGEKYFLPLAQKISSELYIRLSAALAQLY